MMNTVHLYSFLLTGYVFGKEHSKAPKKLTQFYVLTWMVGQVFVLQFLS